MKDPGRGERETRKKRKWYEGACYHVMGRGNRHCTIYRGEEDYAIFLMLLREVQKRYPFILHAYCLMTNHFHLELTTKSDPIWKIMKPIMNHYARTFNRKYGYQGHLFDGRYESCIIEDERYFLEVSRYIHLNPVKAGMVREPLDYKYSSYRCYVDRENDQYKEQTAYIEPDTDHVLSAFRTVPCEQYRMFVEGKISHAEQEMLIMKDMKENELWLPW